MAEIRKFAVIWFCSSVSMDVRVVNMVNSRTDRWSATYVLGLSNVCPRTKVRYLGAKIHSLGRSVEFGLKQNVKYIVFCRIYCGFLFQAAVFPPAFRRPENKAAYREKGPGKPLAP